MLQANAPRRKSPTPASLPQEQEQLSSNPPAFDASPAPPHPVYGRTPMGRDGFTLDRQIIHMLAHWYRKATEYIDSHQSDDDMIDEVRTIQGELVEAIIAYKPNSGRDAARQFDAILREVERADTVTVIGVAEFRSLVEGLTEATKGPEPTKRVGDLSRGGKLTRAGLLHRYHAFLINELHTVSWNLYGNRDYGASMIPYDGEVGRRVRDGFKDGEPKPYRRGSKHYPFHDESKLTARANAVLGSLSVSTTKPDRR